MSHKSRAIIVDLDGTLCDNAHRRHLVECDKPNWPAFFDLMGEDKANRNVLHLIRSFRMLWWGPTILYVSGRYERHRVVTETWLRMVCDLHPNEDDLMMRADGDSRDDTEVKRDIYRWLIEPNYDVRLVLDDRTRVVNMWRSLGLECWQVAPGDF